MSSFYTAIIIDDEPSSVEVLSEVLAIFCPEIEIKARETNPQVGIKLVNKIQPDILFLDIEMPTGSGFDFLDAIEVNDIKVIFTTAHSQYAIQAIRRGVHDFLMKPIDPDELLASIQRLDEEQNDTDENKLAIQCLDKIYMIKPHEIIRCESESNYTHLYLHNNKKITVTLTLKTIESKLDSELFIRVHQSHLVNQKRIVEFKKGASSVLVLSNGDQVPVSHRKKPFVTSVMNLDAV